MSSLYTTAPNLILGVRAEAFNQQFPQAVAGVRTIVKLPLNEAIEKLELAGMWIGPRNCMDKTEFGKNFRHLIPYITLVSSDGTEVLTYQRTKQAGESRLAGDFSIGYGGHIELCDLWIDHTDPEGNLELVETFRANIVRELDEELELSIDTEGSCLADTAETLNTLSHFFKGLIIDNSNAVGEVHIGLSFVIPIDSEIFINPYEKEDLEKPFNDDGITDGKFVSINELDQFKMESWSVGVAAEVLK